MDWINQKTIQVCITIISLFLQHIAIIIPEWKTAPIGERASSGEHNHVTHHISLKMRHVSLKMYQIILKIHHLILKMNHVTLKMQHIILMTQHA